MSFRFQKRITLFKGLSINFSKTGTSFSIGPRGAKLNVRGDKVTGTMGIPGTGLSYRKRLGGNADEVDTLDNQPTPSQVQQQEARTTNELSWKKFGVLSFIGFLIMTYLFIIK